MMGSADRFLIVNADDFGRSETVNAGVTDAFHRGILTSTSIVATGTAFGSAVALAGQNPGLGIGIHLVLDRQHEPALPPHRWWASDRIGDSPGRPGNGGRSL